MSEPVEELKRQVESLMALHDGWKAEALSLRSIRDEYRRIHRILTHIAEHGIHTDRVDAHITMSMADQKEDLVTVLEREIQR